MNINERGNKLKTRTILNQMNVIEDKHGKMFHEIDRDLERRIWLAIDSKSLFQMECIIKELDKLT